MTPLLLLLLPVAMIVAGVFLFARRLRPLRRPLPSERFEHTDWLDKQQPSASASPVDAPDSATLDALADDASDSAPTTSTLDR